MYDILETVFLNDSVIFRSNDHSVIAEIKFSDIYGILAAPPCTMFSLARTTAKIPRDLAQGMRLVEVCMKIIWGIRVKQKLAFWALENPMGYLRQFLGNPLYTFDPSQFGEQYNKTTDLWGYFKPPKRKKKKGYFEETKNNTRKLPDIPENYLKDKKMVMNVINDNEEVRDDSFMDEVKLQKYAGNIFGINRN